VVITTQRYPVPLSISTGGHGILSAGHIYHMLTIMLFYKKI